MVVIFHAIADYCIISTYDVFPTFWLSLKLVALSCVPNIFKAAVTLFVNGVYRKCDTDSKQKHLRRNGERPYVKCIHLSQEEVKTSLQIPSAGLSAPLCCQHHLST